MKTAGYTLRDFVRDLETIVGDRTQDRDQILRKVAARLKKLIGRKKVLPQGATRFTAERYGRHLLYKSERKKFVVMALAWGPGQSTPIHDHGTWGVAAVYKNILRIVNYKLNGARRNGHARLKLASIVDGRAGAVSTVLPPDEEIHMMTNATRTPTISIHVYGKELKACNTFDPVTNKIKRFALSPPTLYRQL